MGGPVVRARRCFAMVVACAAALVVGVPVASADPPTSAGPMRQVFADGFGSLDSSVWERGWGSDAAITGPMSNRCLASANVSVVSTLSDTFLRLQLTRLPSGQTTTCTDPSGSATAGWLGGLVDSQPRSGHPGFTYRYGYVEWRARTTQSPTGTECGLGSAGHCIAGLPQLWSMDTNHNYEIDTLEGQHGKACYDTHPPSDAPAQCQGPAPYNDGGWHTYGSLWTPSGTDYYYDGAPVGHLDTVPTSQFLVMDMIEGAPDVDGATLDVDSVKVWKSDSDGDGVIDDNDACPNLSGPVSSNGCPAPVNTSAPVVSFSGGGPTIGEVASATTGSWYSANSPTSYSYQWSDCDGSSCTAISGATSATYAPVATDSGYRLQVAVTAFAAGPTQASASSALTGVITGANASTASAVTGFDFGGGSVREYVVDSSDSKIHEEGYAPSSGWAHSGALTSSQVATGTKLTAFNFGNGGDRIYFVAASDNKIHQLSYNPGTGYSESGALTTTTVEGSGMFAINYGAGTVRIYFVSSSDHTVHQLSYNQSTGWTEAGVGSSTIASGSAITGFRYGTSGIRLYVVAAADGKIHEIAYDSSTGWTQSGALTSAVVTGNTPTAFTYGTGGAIRVYFVSSTDSKVHELAWNAGTGYTESGAMTPAVAPNTGLAGFVYGTRSVRVYFSAAADTKVHELAYDPATAWTAGGALTTASTTGSMNAFVFGSSGAVRVYFVASSDHMLRQLSYNAGTGYSESAAFTPTLIG